MHDIDSLTSRDFLDGFKNDIGHDRALDCGAGIGRVTKHVLLNKFEKIDLVEPSTVQIEKAKTFIDSPKVDNFYCVGL